MIERTKLRHRVNVSTTIGLTVIWMLLWGKVTWGTALFGLIVALLIQLAFPLPDVEELDHFRPVQFLRLAVTTLAGLVVASITVGAKVLAFWLPTKNAMIRVPMRTNSQFIVSVTAELTTLVPGSIVIDADDSGLLVHVFDAATPAKIENARLRVQQTEAMAIRAFGDAEERAMLTGEGRSSDHPARLDTEEGLE